jgi:hypothetical protein
VAAYTLKGLRVFKVRKNLADEGKNHAELILVEAKVFGGSAFRGISHLRANRL